MMSQLFAPSLPPQEIVLRGTVVYLSHFALLRLMQLREADVEDRAHLRKADMDGDGRVLESPLQASLTPGRPKVGFEPPPGPPESFPRPFA
jgi:hypothetical protein